MTTKKISSFVEKEDLKEYQKWINNNQKLFFKNNDFYTKLFNLVFHQSYPKSFWEFFVFNNLELKNKYDLFKFYPQLKSIDSLKIVDDILINFKNIFILFDQDKKINFEELFKFFNAYIEYQFLFEKNYEKEYELLKLYWEFLDDVTKKHIINFNKFIIYINKHIYIKQKGFK